MDKWFTPPNILNMIYIGVTALFSFLIWRATKLGAKSTEIATKAAENSYNLTRDLYDKQINLEEQLKRQCRISVYVQSLTVLDIAKKLCKEITSDVLTKVPLKFEVQDEQVAKYFNESEQLLISRAKLNIDLIRRDLFKSGIPNFTVNEETKGRIESMYHIHKELTDRLEKVPS